MRPNEAHRAAMYSIKNNNNLALTRPCTATDGRDGHARGYPSNSNVVALCIGGDEPGSLVGLRRPLKNHGQDGLERYWKPTVMSRQGRVCRQRTKGTRQSNGRTDGRTDGRYQPLRNVLRSRQACAWFQLRTGRTTTVSAFFGFVDGRRSCAPSMRRGPSTLCASISSFVPIRNRGGFGGSIECRFLCCHAVTD
jgi:hypothetical protein